MQNAPCPLCKSKNQLLIYPAHKNIKLSIKDFAVTKTSVKKLDVIKCNKCLLLYSLPPKNLISRYSDVTDENYEKDKEIREKEFEIAFKSIRKHVQFPFQKIKILDIGCLTGIFLDYVKRQSKKFDCYGIEPSRWAVEICKKKGLKMKSGYFESVNYSKNYFDIITLFDCIEHVEEPNKVLKKTYSILKKNGLLIMSTPNINSIFHKIFKKYFWFIEAMHLFYFSSKTITKILEDNNFKVIEIKKHYKYLTLGYAIQRVIINLNTMVKFLPISIASMPLLRKIQVKFYAGQMLVVARKK
ncbi:MAG: class I SAM-dependent methyltransferase [Candidatus Levybacteria bacterium]|nr:class I SAM-dependent methyltransferase [Candidatus Levybacteria bacterium]